MSELEFLNAVLERADCLLLLDVNNIYVNSVNHGYDALEFLYGLPQERIAYGHIAGHYREAPDLIIDTHGSDVADPVWELLQRAYARFGAFPTVLERDFEIPPLPELVEEAGRIGELQRSHTVPAAAGPRRRSTVSPPEALQELQRRFARHLRDPENAPAPEGLEDRRMAVYRAPGLHNVSSLLAEAFPVLRSVTSEERWTALMRDFLSSPLPDALLPPPAPGAARLPGERAQRARRSPLAAGAGPLRVDVALRFDRPARDRSHRRGPGRRPAPGGSRGQPAGGAAFLRLGPCTASAGRPARGAPGRSDLPARLSGLPRPGGFLETSPVAARLIDLAARSRPRAAPCWSGSRRS